MTDTPHEGPFADLDAFLALPRLSGLTLSPGGDRLVVAVATLRPKKTSYATSLWSLDPSGATPARRLTRSRKGDSSARFTDAGDLLFTSARPDPDADEDEDGPAALWLLPSGGGDPRLLCNRPGGIEAVREHRGTVVLSASVLAGSVAEDDALVKRRRDTKVNARLYQGYPVRDWDADLGPGRQWLIDQLTRLVCSCSC